MKLTLTILTCALALACNKGSGSTAAGAPTAAAAPAAAAGLTEKDLHGTWKINVDEVKKLAESMEKAGKKDEAMGVALIGATQMTLVFSPGKAETRMINPFSDKGETKVENSTFEVASISGDTLKLNMKSEKGVEPVEITIKGKQLTLKDEKGPAVPFTRE